MITWLEEHLRDWLEIIFADLSRVVYQLSDDDKYSEIDLDRPTEGFLSIPEAIEDIQHGKVSMPSFTCLMTYLLLSYGILLNYPCTWLEFNKTFKTDKLISA